MQTKRSGFRYPFIAFGMLFVLSTSCGKQTRQPPVKLTTHSFVKEPPEKRIEIIEKLMANGKSRPAELGQILQAQLLQEQYGDGRLGPSDFRFYARISISPETVPAWKETLGPPDESLNYAGPDTAPDWWISEAAFDALPRFNARPLFHHSGWVVIRESESGAQVYVTTFSM